MNSRRKEFEMWQVLKRMIREKTLMRKFVLVAAVAAVFAAPASATPPTSFAFSYDEQEIPIVTHTAGPNTFYTLPEWGTFFGDIAGSVTATDTWMVQPDGSVELHSNIVCACTVAGRTGTLTLQLQGRGSFLPAPHGGGSTQGAGSGGLAGLHVVGAWTVTPDDNFVEFAGTYHFDP
jgi:hypothetical protein